jgi:acetolactate synthase-1/2/3 large subunit
MQSPRGIADPALGALAQVLAEADTVLLLAKRLDFTLGFGGALHPQCEVMQFDAEPAEFERSARALGSRLVQREVCDAPLAVAGLIAAAARSPGASERSANHRPWLREVHEAIAWRPPEWQHLAGSRGALHPLHACATLQPLLAAHPDAVFVSDGGEFGQWAQTCLSAPHTIINGVAGAIGAALPFAIAARLAVPASAPVIAFSGDGSFGFHPAEIETALRHHLPFVAVVGNDARWNAEHQIQLREYGAARTHGLTMQRTRYDRVCVAFGGHGEQVTDAAELPAAAQRALASGLPACIDAPITSVGAPLIRRPV